MPFRRLAVRKCVLQVQLDVLRKPMCRRKLGVGEIETVELGYFMIGRRGGQRQVLREIDEPDTAFGKEN